MLRHMMVLKLDVAAARWTLQPAITTYARALDCRTRPKRDPLRRRSNSTEIVFSLMLGGSAFGIDR